MDIKESILKRIKPSHEEIERVKRFVSQLQSVAKTVSGMDAVIVGSIGKFTWLAGDHDVDVFLMFDPTQPREELERLGMEFGKRIVEEMGGKSLIKYAEHPYVHAVIRGFDVDIVPCYRIAQGEKIKSAVDRSPLHLQYVLDYIKPSMVDDIRLLKQFCKGIGVYGSDAKNQGFSGYICELLVLNYGSFDKVVHAAVQWRAPFTINIERHLGLSMGKFRDQPLVMIDPVDPERNAAAVVNGENFVKFVSRCKAYLKKPSAGFFIKEKEKPLSPAQLRLLQSRGTKFITLRFKRPDVIDDVLYPQLRAAVERFVSLLEHEEFRVFRAFEFAETDPIIIIELEVWSLPAVKAMVGPPIFNDRHAGEFLQKYEKNFTYIVDNKWVSDVPRKYKLAGALLNNFLKGKPEALAENGVPKYIALAAANKTVLEDKEFWSIVKKDSLLSDYIRKKYFVDDSLEFLESKTSAE
jgi:tRNA nucleotidyltransferase (CCA-adding enzyme)